MAADQDRAVAPATWLITGCSTGIGREIARAALVRGHRVAATARRPESVQDLTGAHPDRAIALRLDVTDRVEIAAAVEATEARLGPIDVLVNNAGYGYMAALEEGEDEEVRRLFDTNYFGAVDMIRAVLPGMRSRRRGHIVNISSMTGLVTNPPNIYYSSTKHALEAVTEGLSKELAPFGIRVTAIEPGAFRTDYVTRSMREATTPIDAYTETVVGQRKALTKAAGDKLPGDPRRLAEAVVMVTELAEPPLHLLLGQDVLAAFRQKLADWQANLDAWEHVTKAVGFATGEN
jgi:NAD(P)-dependent dehydrogenase (short-subunit alcohol dehydrogenase family)